MKKKLFTKILNHSYLTILALTFTGCGNDSVNPNVTLTGDPVNETALTSLGDITLTASDFDSVMAIKDSGAQAGLFFLSNPSQESSTQSSISVAYRLAFAGAQTVMLNPSIVGPSIAHQGTGYTGKSNVTKSTDKVEVDTDINETGTNIPLLASKSQTLDGQNHFQAKITFDIKDPQYPDRLFPSVDSYSEQGTATDNLGNTYDFTISGESRWSTSSQSSPQFSTALKQLIASFTGTYNSTNSTSPAARDAFLIIANHPDMAAIIKNFYAAGMIHVNGTAFSFSKVEKLYLVMLTIGP